MKFEHTDVWGFEHAIRGMRNPLNSWDKSDSDVLYNAFQNFSDDDSMAGQYIMWNNRFDFNFKFGKNDLDLAQRLINGGTEHRKFMRQIMVSVDITAPMYWWSEYDTYKVGTTANSTSKMHKLASTEIERDCFETDGVQNLPDPEDEKFIREFVTTTITSLEYLRTRFNETKDMRYWKELVRWLPESWLQTRTVTFNYENLRNMYFQRRGHKLTEWAAFRDWETTLPYAKELITFE